MEVPIRPPTALYAPHRFWRVNVVDAMTNRPDDDDRQCPSANITPRRRDAFRPASGFGDVIDSGDMIRVHRVTQTKTRPATRCREAPGTHEKQ
jgi:hypothetical protein